MILSLSRAALSPETLVQIINEFDSIVIADPNPLSNYIKISLVSRDDEIMFKLKYYHLIHNDST